MDCLHCVEYAAYQVYVLSPTFLYYVCPGPHMYGELYEGV